LHNSFLKKILNLLLKNNLLKVKKFHEEKYKLHLNLIDKYNVHLKNQKNID